MELSREYFLRSAEKHFEAIRSFRRHLHQYPELSFREVQTSQYIKEKLTENGILFESLAGTGIRADLGSGKRSIALRADIDALPIQEANDVAYISKHEGIMHACGHDVHSACLFGAILILREVERELKGQVRAIFQPGEEKLPGGALKMIEEGVLENPKPEGIIALHVFPELETGKLGFREGMYMASADEIYITVAGKGGHGAMPDKCIDPIVAAAQIITNIQTIVSRKAPPAIPSVLTFGKINSVGGATNIIPDVVKLEGTFRTLNEEWRMDAHRYIDESAKYIARSVGAEVDCQIVKGYPYLENDEALTRFVRREAIELLGGENIVDLDIRMTAEDFAWYSHRLPACFFRLGVRNESRGIVHAVHTSRFDIDEEALKVGAGVMAWLAYQHLCQ